MTLSSTHLVYYTVLLARMGDALIEEIDYDNPPFPLTSIDRELLAMRDEDFHRITWDDLKSIISTRDFTSTLLGTH